MKAFSWKLSLLYSLLSFSNLYSQETIKAVNLRYIDSAENSARTSLCANYLKFPKRHDLKGLNKDETLITLLNECFGDSFKIKDLGIMSKKLKVGITRRELKVAGLLKTIVLHFKGDYIQAQLTIDYIDDLVIRKKCSIRTLSNGECSAAGYRIVDFKLLKDFVLRNINFGITLVDNEMVIRNQFEYQNAMASVLMHKAYRFFPDKNKNKLNLDFFNSDSSCVYKFKSIPREIAILVKEKRRDILINLLYCPNFYYSLAAMEAITYLMHKGGLKIDDSDKKQMEIIKDADFRISVQFESDLYRDDMRYKDLEISPEMIIYKFETLLANNNK